MLMRNTTLDNISLTCKVGAFVLSMRGILGFHAASLASGQRSEAACSYELL
jgi:hypothetical protein